MASDFRDGGFATAAIKTLVALGMSLVACLPLLILRFEGWLFMFGIAGFLGLPGIPMDGGIKLRAAGVALIPVTAGLYGLSQVWAMATEYAAGRVFSVKAHRSFSRFALVCLILAVAMPFIRCLMGFAFTYDLPQGNRVLVLGLQWHDLLHVLFGLILVSITSVMRRGREAAQENASFV